MCELLIILSGLHFIAFFGFHLLFWRMFSWREELLRLSEMNRAVMQLMNLALIFFFLFFGVLLIAFRAELTVAPLGRALLAGLALFWFARGVQQVYFFGLKTRQSLVLTVLFFLGTALNAIPLLS